MASERTYVMVKPDGVQRNLVGEIIGRFERKGFKLVGMKMCAPGKAHFEKHYESLAGKPFFAGLVAFMTSGPVVSMAWEGTKVVSTARQMLGETDPLKSLPGTIRGDFCVTIGRNIIHASDSVETANAELAHWFKDEELHAWTPAQTPNVYE